MISDLSVVTAAVLKAPAEELSAFVSGEARELRLFSFVCVVSFIPELCRGDRVLDWRKKKYIKRFRRCCFKREKTALCVGAVPMCGDSEAVGRSRMVDSD